MRDYIFITGPSGVGKTTLAKKLYKHYKSVYLEQHMIPEFLTIDGENEVNGELEEQTLWTSTVALLQNFHHLGYKNVIALDFNDLRTRDIPITFKGTNFIILKLTSSNFEQNLSQMLNRESGLIDKELLEKSAPKINERKPLINEFAIDINGKTADQVANEAILLVDTAKVILDYDYEIPPKELFHSWVKSDNLD